MVSVDFKTSGRCLPKGGKYVAGTSFIAFHFTAMTKTNKFNDGDFQQVCTSVGTLQNNHENIHFRFRTLTMQMCCWIVDLNYLTL